MPSDTRGGRLSWTLFWTYSLFLLQGSLIPGEKIPRFLQAINDKFLHGLEYFILFWISAVAFRQTRAVWLQSQVTRMGLAWCLALGIITEVFQSFVPNRHASLWDAAADFIGAGLAALWLKWKSARSFLSKS